ncbi:DDE-type integrase/transposase/recombinase [Lactococcus cremoris]|uniref:DDE-type integrase/transposase/recombinase n=1 Tax=Lactococcus TaxID=1357 RepID=UPI0037BF5117
MSRKQLHDKAPSLGSAFRKLQSVGLYTKTEHRTVKYLNNLIEQDHQPIKRRNKFCQSLRTASSTIKGMETLRGIYKKNRRMMCTPKVRLFIQVEILGFF